MEQELLQSLQEQEPALRNNPQLILQKIDERGGLRYNNTFNNGIVLDQVKQLNRGQTVVEVGDSLGFTAMLTAINTDPETHIYLFEEDHELNEITKTLIDLAGFNERITIHDSKSDVTCLRQLKNIDLLIMNSNPFEYLLTLRKLESMNLIHKDTTIITINALPDFLHYIKAAPITKKEYNYKMRGATYGKWSIIYDSISIINKNSNIEVTKCSSVLN